MRTRVSPARVGLMLIVAACALVVFIGLLGDVRRKRTALDQMRRYGESLMIRVGDAKPLSILLWLLCDIASSVRQVSRTTP